MAHASETQLCVETYRELKNLKLVGDQLGIAWQRVYILLRRADEPVTGDKARYGSRGDRLAAKAERWFQDLVPSADDLNHEKFQAKIDFRVAGQGVDVKVASVRPSKTGVRGWCWCLKKQERIADYFVCIALSDDGLGDELNIANILLIPGEAARHYQTLRASEYKGALRGKWWDFLISADDLRSFFEEIG